MVKIYHYTTIDVLALMLKNKTLRFNSLTNVDDQEEAETQDEGSLKKHVFVSCWTDDEYENIGLWQMYGKNMKGIRIGIDPVKIKFRSNEKIMIPVNPGITIPVYAVINNIISPVENSAFIVYGNSIHTGFDGKLRVKYDLNEKYNFLVKDSEHIAWLNFEDLAGRKRKEWSFQKEIRYVLFGTSTEKLDGKLTHEFVMHHIGGKASFSCDYVDLILEDTFFDDIEVLLGPLITQSDHIICESLLEHFIKSKKYIVTNSRLKIKSKNS
jgi:hypothetical protein